MRRSEIHDQTLVKNSNKFQCPNQCPDHTVMNTKHLVNDFDFEPGYRVGLTFTENPKMSFEAISYGLLSGKGKKQSTEIRA